VQDGRIFIERVNEPFLAAAVSSLSISMPADQWPDDGRLSYLEDTFTYTACGQRGADERPDFDWHLKKAQA
jgi:hypothetical protein